MSKVDDARALFHEGARVECVENTYLPDRVGGVRTVTKVGKSFMDCQVDGKPFRMALPRRARDVLSIEYTTLRFNLRGPGDPARLDGHTIAYRVMGANER